MDKETIYEDVENLFRPKKDSVTTDKFTQIPTLDPKVDISKSSKDHNLKEAQSNTKPSQEEISEIIRELDSKRLKQKLEEQKRLEHKFEDKKETLKMVKENEQQLVSPIVSISPVLLPTAKKPPKKKQIVSTFVFFYILKKLL